MIGTHSQARLLPAAAILLAGFCAIYAPEVGHGFVKDDFNWIHTSRAESSTAAQLLFGAPTGFYRPAVSFSFRLNESICGVRSRCYGLTNLGLALACAAAVFMLARALSMSAPAALLAAALWLFNWHGINMAVLWISGRTALMLVLFATLAAASFAARRMVLAALFLIPALFAKEEAIVLPVALVAWAAADRLAGEGRWQWRQVATFAACAAAIALVYLWMRQHSGAFTPATAPPYYRLELSLPRIGANLPAYLDRSATFALTIAVLWLLVARPHLTAIRPVRRGVLLFGALWWAASLAITVFLPVRSGLYACLPSVGVALIVASFTETSARTVPFRRLRIAAAAGLLLPFLLWPFYALRNRNAVREADLSSATIRALDEIAKEKGQGVVVLLKDDRSRRPSLDGAFGTLLPVALELMIQPPIRAWIDPPPVDAAYAGLSDPEHPDVTLTLRDGALVRDGQP